MAICIKIDIREEDLWKEVQMWTKDNPNPEGWFTEKTVLDVGDVSFHASQDLSGVSLVTLERKKAEDFGASQKDGRYREQRARLYALRGRNTAIAYLVEVPPWSPTLTRSWCRGEFTEVHLQQSIVRLQLRHTIPVFMASTIKESVQWIRRIAKALHADPTCYQCGMATTLQEAAEVYADTIHVKKAVNNTPERIFLGMVMSIPGLGKASAEAIAKATNSSFQKLLEFSEQQISEIQAGKRKVGTKVGACVFQAIHS
jgi:ERCC4-type nuclease